MAIFLLTGTIDGSELCDKTTGNCYCRAGFVGKTCNQCEGNTFTMNFTSPNGCEQCNCDPSGTHLGDQLPPDELTCDPITGECDCLEDRTGRRCETCLPGECLLMNIVCLTTSSSAGEGCNQPLVTAPE